MSGDKTNWEQKCVELQKLLNEERANVKYYQEIAQVTGRKSLREVSQLSRLVADLRRAEAALRESEENFRALAENANDGILIATGRGDHVYANRRGAEVTGYSTQELLKIGFKDLAQPDERRETDERHKRILEGKYVPPSYEGAIIAKDGRRVAIEITDAKTMWQGQPALIVMIRDITERRRREEALRKKDAELEMKTNNLEEVNTALRVLLRRREEDKAELEEKVLSNVKDLVLPYLEKLKKTSLDTNQVAYLTILESNLNDIVSPFSRQLSSKHLGLTPTEIRIAGLVKDGRTTREIAELMNSSRRTVESHRENIRRKVGIKNQKVNLATYLSSIQ